MISQNATSKPIERRGGTQKPPHAFTRDNFVDDRILTLLDKRDDDVEATIHTRFNESFLTDLRKHNDQYREIKYVQLPHKNHDRFLIIDDGVYFLGASVKDMGVGMCAVTKMQTPPNIILQLLK